MNTAKMLEQAARQINSGNHKRAEETCREVLRQEPNHATAWHYLSMIEQRKGKLESALGYIDQAIKSGGRQPAYCMLKGNLLQDSGRFPEAEACFRETIQLKPRFAQAYNNLGIVLRDQKKTEAAIEAFGRAVSLDARYFRAYNNLGTALQSVGRMAEAVECYKSAIEFDPGYFIAMHNLATAYLSAGNRADAELWFRKALNLKPEYAPSCLAYGRLLLEQREYADAEACCLQAIKVDQQNVDALNLLGEVWAIVGNTAQALGAYQRGMAIDSRNLRSAMGLNLTLPQVYQDRAALEAARARFEKGLRALRENVGFLAQNTADKILADIQWNNFYLAYQGKDDKLLQKEFSCFVEDVLMLTAPQYMAPRSQKSKSDRRIRVGFLGSFFYKCTAGTYFNSWISGLDRDRFEIFVYYTHFDRDKVTEQVKASSDHFKQMPYSLLRIADEVLGDELDILVYPEVGMNGKTCVLSAMRLAPVQCAGWGHPVTTGHINMDYYFSSVLMEPENAQNHYTEKLVLLPGIGTHYPIIPLPAPLERADLALPENRNLYLCPQSLFKIHPDNDELFLKILEGDDNGVLVFFTGRQEAITRAFIKRLTQAFEARGLETTGRVKILPNLDHDDYLRVNMACDVMLDTLYWSGGNTSLDAFSCGLPIVTLPGEFMRGRQSYGMLRLMGVAELIADNEDDYVRIALRLGKNQDYRKEVSERILANTHKILEDEAPIKAFTRFLIQFAESL